MAGSVVNIQLCSNELPAHLAERLVGGATDKYECVRHLVQQLESMAAGANSAKLRVRVDSSTAKAASLAIVIDISDGDAGEKIWIGRGGAMHAIAIVASGAVAASGEINAGTDDTVAGNEFVACCKQMPGLRELVTASNSTGTVTVTARDAGPAGNLIQVKDNASAGTYAYTGSPGAAAPAYLAGGANVGAVATATITVVHANVDADDDITIGNVTLTWKASPSGENQMDIKTSDATDAAELAAIVNAHSQLGKMMSASAADDVVTLTLWGGGLDAQNVQITTDDATAHTIVAFATTTTEAGQSAAVEYDFGVA